MDETGNSLLLEAFHNTQLAVDNYYISAINEKPVKIAGRIFHYVRLEPSDRLSSSFTSNQLLSGKRETLTPTVLRKSIISSV